MRKQSDAKKPTEDEAQATSSGTQSTKGASKSEDDVYEFKSTPKDSSGDDKSDGGKGSDKSSDEKSDDQGTKRSYSDVEVAEDVTVAEEDQKRKKRTPETATKEVAKSTSRAGSQRQEKNPKGAAGASSSKSANSGSKAAASAERKSPCGSPKPQTSKGNDSDAENEDNKSLGDLFNSTGPKVPPLKIVIPQQRESTGPDQQETGSRSNKSASIRSHAALPYVVASSSNSNDSADKESASSRCASPSESTKSVEEKKNAAQTADDQRQQRVLRSHRGGHSVDRGSNNSSPQLQSTSPSPATVATTGTATTTSTTTTTTDPVASGSVSNGNVKGSSSSTVPVNQSTSDTDAPGNVPSPSAPSTSFAKDTSHVELHPRKRKIRASRDENRLGVNVGASTSAAATAATANSEAEENLPSLMGSVALADSSPSGSVRYNTIQMYLNLRKEVDRKHSQMFPVTPKPPRGFHNYLMIRKTYALTTNSDNEPKIIFPPKLPPQMRKLFEIQERERYKWKMQHIVEREKLVITVECEILRLHQRAAQALANQVEPYSVCAYLRDCEIFNFRPAPLIELDRSDLTARSRYSARLFRNWLQDLDDKWEKIKVRSIKQHIHAIPTLIQTVVVLIVVHCI